MAKKKLAETPLSVLDLALVRDQKTIAETFVDSTDLARHVEKWGYKRFWLAEHHNMEGVASSATAVLIGHIASQTQAIRVGSGGIMLPNHAPLMVAEQFGTLETLYPGRIDLGLGRAPGTDQLTAAALRRDPMAAHHFPASIAELQKYFSSANAKGPIRAIPGEGLAIPIWILGSSTDSAYLAAELGLPYAFASHFAPAQLHQALAIYRQNFRPSVVLKESYVLTCISAIVADTNEEADRLATSFKRLYLSILTGKREKLKPPVAPGFLDAMQEAALRQMIEYSFVGSAEKVSLGLQQFIDKTGADELMITSPVYEHAARLRAYELIGDLRLA
jgi:luciferase family oxidoreductase group 1